MNFRSLLRKWWAWAIVVLLLLFGITIVLTKRYFTPWLKDKLETTVHAQTKGLYTLKLYGFSTSLPGARIAADSVHFIPDFTVWEKHDKAAKKGTPQKDKVPRTLLDLRTNELVISGVNFLEILQGKPLDVRLLKVQQPVLQVTEIRPDTTQQQEPLHKMLQGIAKNLHINRIQLQNGTIRIKEGRKAKTDKIYAANFTIEVEDLRLDSASFYDRNRAYYAKNLALESGEVGYSLPDGTYKLQAGAVKANTADGTLNIGDFKVLPLLKYSEMARREGKAISRIKLTVPEINVSGVNYSTHSRYSNLAAKRVVIKNPSLSAYMDKKNYVQRGEKPLPHDLVQQLKTGLTIARLNVQNMQVRYEELVPEATQTGKLTIENIQASIRNISNDKNLMSGKTPAVAHVRGSINGTAPIKATIRLNLLDPGGYHTLKGSVGPANAATLNPILEPTAFISIKEGRIQKSDFSIELNRTKATGNLNLYYSNLKVDVLSKDEDKRQTFRKKILSKIANKVVLKSDNPKEGESLRPGPINVARSRKRSVISYWKDCLLSGFRSAAGVEKLGADLQDPNR
ncbi:AsmA family protein [Pontibacter fetidus]|uniref:DUF748 domain-containing protein n=1 Tax=Pontibacter fetidus TaxID=2700082 RepID=A0A6B2GWL2_9BACT|nr:DUF748 domain-containing protein [Pontibacter fetidus]NDK54373.1 DUF748 domain-containing protein [Pontibacter fetidus]